MRRAGIVALMLVLLCTVTHAARAYTYTYHNKTDYAVRIDVWLYDEAHRVAQIAPGQSQSISTKFLIKSWAVDVLADNGWKQALELTCDLLPGDHTFSIYVKEVGEGKRDWYVIKE